MSIRVPLIYLHGYSQQYLLELLGQLLDLQVAAYKVHLVHQWVLSGPEPVHLRQYLPRWHLPVPHYEAVCQLPLVMLQVHQ